MPSFRRLLVKWYQSKYSLKRMTHRIVGSVAIRESGSAKKLANAGETDPNFDPFIRIDNTEELQMCAENNPSQLQGTINHDKELLNVMVDSVDDSHGPFGEGSSTEIICTRTHEEQSNKKTERTLICEHIRPREAQAEPSIKLFQASKPLIYLYPRLYKEIAVINLQGYVDILQRQSGTPISDSHQNDDSKNPYLYLIDSLKLVLKKLYGSRQDVADGVDDIWEIMVQVDQKNDHNSHLSSKSRSRSTTLVNTRDPEALKLIQCHKSPFWPCSLLISLKTLQNGITAELCNEYDFSLEAVKGIVKDLLEILQWLRSQPAPPGLIENTPNTNKLQWAANRDRTPSSVYGREDVIHNNGPEGNGSILSETTEKRHASIDGMLLIDGPFDTRSPEVAAIASRFHVGTEATSSDTASCLIVESMGSISCDIAAEKGLRAWDSFGLLQIADRVRGECDEDALVLSSDLVLVDCIFKDILKRELHEEVSITFFDIMFSRLDKLLDHLIGMEENDLPQAKGLKQVIGLAALVKQSWHKRFQGRLSTIDQDRVRIILENLKFQLHSKSGYPILVPQRNPRVQIEEIQLEIGQWWPNITCIYRDGFVNRMSVGKEYRTSAIPTIPLLNGIEIHDKIAGCLRYTAEGPLKAMKLRLQSKVGETIRLLRGYKLKSLLAPEAGIRYDGLYYLSRYGHEYADPTKGIFRMTLWYKQVTGQAAISSDTLLYKPSMRDDWQLYQTAADEEVKKSSTTLNYAAWKDAEEKEMMDCKQWRSEQIDKEQKESDLHPKRLAGKSSTLHRTVI